MLDHVGIFKEIRLFLKRILGFEAFKEVTSGETLNKRAYAIQAKDGDLTYSATTANGDNISSGSVLQQDAQIVGEFNSVSVDAGSSGDAIVYLL